MPIKQPSEKAFAQLLNITIEEYKKLKHAPLIADINIMGSIIGYFMHISMDNDAEVLKKIIIVKSNFVWFSVKQIDVVSKI